MEGIHDHGLQRGFGLFCWTKRFSRVGVVTAVLFFLYLEKRKILRTKYPSWSGIRS